ncbi:MAG TPA: non-heme iron oxygenase ferredoxin subunit [Gaiellaceae bacterium]|nr:non-heme iron oxygenase ferredoxin subunit [Gaiellaceae bacterium]
MSEWIAVGSADGAEGELRAVEAGGVYLALARVGGEWFAFDDDCTHEDCPLSDGELAGTAVVCGCHGSEFDLRTGDVLAGPATEPIVVYPVRVVDGELEVELG